MTSYTLPPDVEAKLCTPSLIVYADVVRANIERIKSACGGAER